MKVSRAKKLVFKYFWPGRPCPSLVEHVLLMIKIPGIPGTRTLLSHHKVNKTLPGERIKMFVKPQPVMGRAFTDYSAYVPTFSLLSLRSCTLLFILPLPLTKHAECRNHWSSLIADAKPLCSRLIPPTLIFFLVTLVLLPLLCCIGL